MTARVRRSIRGAKKRGGDVTPPKKTGWRVRGGKLVMSPKLPIKLYKEHIKLYKSHVNKMK